MNIIRVLSYVSRRTYTRNVNVGIEGKLKLSRNSGLKVDAEELDHDDLDEFEAEFTNADQFYDIYEREQHSSKEMCKNHIVANKYFKETKDPNFLTSIEKHKIRELHKNNPEEWTVERLSESFPALPETIKKILKSDWLPDSIEKVVQYDTTVKDNWKQFQAGSIPVSPLLRKHLEKFKDRQIVLPDEDLLAKTIMQSKLELPKPKSKYFSGLIESDLNHNKNNQYDNEKLQDGKEITNKDISQDMDKEILDKNNDLFVIKNSGQLRNKASEKRLTWNEFAKRELPKIYETCPEKAITLLQVYKNQYESQNTSATNIKENIAESNNIKKDEYNKEETTLHFSNINDTSHVSIVPTEVVDINLDTYIKERNSKISDNEMYSYPIKIPRNIYQKGKIYRISDCYYDDNGQFLYRVPGVRN